MSHVTKEICTHRVSNSSELGIVPLTRVCAATANDQIGSEELSALLQFLIVDQARLRVDLPEQGYRGRNGGRWTYKIGLHYERKKEGKRERERESERACK